MDSIQEIIDRAHSLGRYLVDRNLEMIINNQNKISLVLELLSDAYSKRVYCSDILQCVLLGFVKNELTHVLAGLLTPEDCRLAVLKMREKKILPELDFPQGAVSVEYNKTCTFILEQYRYADKVKIGAGDICLDVGSGLGETAIWMKEQGAGEVYTFEINRDNITSMTKTYAKRGEWKDIPIVPYACGAHQEKLYFTPSVNHPGGGHVKSVRGDNPLTYEVESVRIDDFCLERGIKPGFIKMDIEGAEMEALAGARNTIRKFRPKLAISIYHKFEHRFQIPLMLAEICPNYDFYCKKSAMECETIFYGISRL